jgi:hypothetical protein
MTAPETYREIGERAWSWVLDHVREQDGPWLPVSVTESWDEARPPGDRDCLYDGIAGLAPALAEIAETRSLSGTEVALAHGIVDRLSTTAATRTEASLYDGLAGHAVALRMLSPDRVPDVLHRLGSLSTAEGWPTALDVGQPEGACLADLVLGTAGVVMAAVWVGGEQARSVALTGCEALVRAADRTEHGLDWGSWPGAPSRGPNYSHGTAGIASALAVAGTAFDRPDLVQAAVLGAQHLLAIGSLADGGFVVPHTVPPSKREVEPVTYTWCHGPAGTSHLFAALARAGVLEVSGLEVHDLRRRCLRSIRDSGAPRRLRPGFWDNDGRCCGTAGVGDVLLDAAQDSSDRAVGADLLTAAQVMGDALVERAIQDESGVFWRFVEHRDDPPLLPPGTSWMQGAAGIAAFLIRLARVVEQGLDASVVDRADQWWAVPPRVRRSNRPQDQWPLVRSLSSG